MKILGAIVVVILGLCAILLAGRAMYAALIAWKFGEVDHDGPN